MPDAGLSSAPDVLASDPSGSRARGASIHRGAHSAIYVGRVRHQRWLPRRHSFQRSLFMVYLDLAEITTVFRGRWLWSTGRPALAWLRRADYIGNPSQSIDEAVRARVCAQLGKRPTGPIRMLTHLRYWGICFNPVTFYYCFDPSDSVVETIVAEITNTPWNERHAYVLHNPRGCNGASHRFDKKFHVSPFMEADVEYQWSFTDPGDHLGVHMRNIRATELIFDATLTLRRREITTGTLARVLALFPVMTLQVLATIYWQALRLLLKRIPIYPHRPAAANGPAVTDPRSPSQ